MVNRPRPRVKLTRREVFRRDNYTCQYCGRKVNNLTIDHVIPRHLGGAHTWTNVVAACPSCNHQKGGRRLEEAHMTLINVPREPPASAQYIFRPAPGWQRRMAAIYRRMVAPNRKRNESNSHRTGDCCFFWVIATSSSAGIGNPRLAA